MKILYKIASYLGVFMLGAYASSEFRYHEPIASYRWILTSWFVIFFIVASNTKKD